MIALSLRFYFTKTLSIQMGIRRVTEEEFNPVKEDAKRRRKQKSRRRAARKKENVKRSKATIRLNNIKNNPKRKKVERRQENSQRTTDQRKQENSKRTNEQRKQENSKRTKEQRRLENSARGRKKGLAEMRYDISSPYPPTKQQVNFCGQILTNSIAALFAQQSPAAEITYASTVSEELISYTRPIIDFAMHQFRHECGFRFSGDLSFTLASANKALATLDKILVLNNQYQLMFDFNVWDVQNAPSLRQLKQLSARHPFQPISEALMKEVDSCRNLIHEQVISITKQRQSDLECNEDVGIDDDGSSQPTRPPSRYVYPQLKRYCHLENNLVCNAMGGTLCEESNARDFKICINELIAFLINSDAKFTKVYREGVSKCFLMPAEFKDDAMRNFYRVKYQEFVDNTGNFSLKIDDHKEHFFDGRRRSVSENVDFAEEHLERRKVEREWAIGTGVVSVEESDGEIGSPNGNHDTTIDGDSPPVTDDFFGLTKDGRRINCSRFDAEVKRAQKHSLDAREVCLTEWVIRDQTHELLEKLWLSMQQIITRKHIECDCKEKEARSCKTFLDQADRYLKLLRNINEDLENRRPVSQILEDTILKLVDLLNRFRELIRIDDCTELDQQVFLDRIDAVKQYYVTLGTHNTSLFYKKNDIYQKLKSRSYKICCVCGIKSSIADESDELKNAVAFKELLVVEDGELAEWKALKNDDEDELGALAQQCFHIAKVEHDKQYYHLLNVDDPDTDNPLEKSCCLINDGKLSRLPACDECFDRLKKANKLWKEETETKESPADLDSSSKGNDREISTWDTAISMLKRLCFRRCDLGRIPKTVPKLSNCGRTAIAPFVAYTIIR